MNNSPDQERLERARQVPANLPEAAAVELERLATHEAGHVLCHWHFGGEIVAVTLNESDGQGGACWGRS